MDDSLNIFGEPLKECSNSPMTGFFRNGCCDTSNEDYGSHTVCILATKNFLDFSASVGNDLSTPMPAAGFTGLNPGDQWCLCAARWEQARVDGKAPKVRLAATNQVTLAVCQLDDLKAHAIDLN